MEKQKLIDAIWPDTLIGESTLSQNVFTARKALGQTQGGHQYIETIPGHGYRFVEPVQMGEEQSDVLTPPSQEAQLVVENVTDRDERLDSLAVLPMDDLSGDVHLNYISAGLTESLIYNLSRVPGLRVMSLNTVFRYKRIKDLDAQQVGRELGVRVVLVGRLFELADRIRVRMELVDVDKGWTLWSEQYDRDFSSIITLQVDITRQILSKLRFKLTDAELARLTKWYSENSEAYRLYLRARHSWNKHTKVGYEQALEYSNQAVAIDPDFALGYTCIADCYTMLVFYGLEPPWKMMPKAKAAGMQALGLDDTLAEAYTSLGCIKMLYEWDWVSAEADFQQAIYLNPNDVNAYQWRSKYLAALGRMEESKRECHLALAIDPFDPNANAQLGSHYFYARHYKDAVEQLEKTIEIMPEFYLSHLFCGQAYMQDGKYREAIAALERARMLEEAPAVLGFLGHAFALAGEPDKAIELLNLISNLQRRRYVPAYSLAVVNTGLGNDDEAFQWLEKACEERNVWVGWIKVSPEFDRLRSHPRFTQLLRHIGLAN
jgi:serine/threonine-protein kinase